MHDQILTTRAIAVVTCAISAALSFNVGTVVEVHQRVDLWGDFQNDVSAVSNITAVGSTERLELFTVYGDTAVAAVAGLQVQYNAVNKSCQLG